MSDFEPLLRYLSGYTPILIFVGLAAAFGLVTLFLSYLVQPKYPEFEKLKSLKFAVNEDYQEDGYRLKENDEVVIIPPVSGG